MRSTKTRETRSALKISNGDLTMERLPEPAQVAIPLNDQLGEMAREERQRALRALLAISLADSRRPARGGVWARSPPCG